MIFLIRGTSCSGKDTFCDKHFPPHTILSSDQIRLLLTNDMKDQSKNTFVFDHLRLVLETRVRFGTPFTVVNATNLKFKDIVQYIDIADKYGKSVTVISIDPPEVDELIKRMVLRAAKGGLAVPVEVLQKHHASYYNSMDRFKEAESEYANYKFVRIDQEWNIVE